MKPKIALKIFFLVCIFCRANAQDFNWNAVSYTTGSINTNFGVIGSPGITVSMNVSGYTAGLPSSSPAKHIATPQAGAGTTCASFCSLRYAPVFSSPATQSLIITFTFSPAITPLSFALYDIDGIGAVIDSARVTATGPSGARIITMTNVNPTTSFIYGSGTTTATIKGGTGNNTDAQTNVSIAGFVNTLLVTFMGQGTFSLGNMSWTGTVLPVKWVSFSGKKQNDGTVNLHWVTANEQHANVYKIEKSNDGQSFGVIGELPASGKDYNEYTYVDATAGTGNNFYRIRQEDYDNRFNYSEVVLIRKSDYTSQQLIVFPNPVIKTLNINTTDNAQIKSIQIFDALGQLVRSYSNSKNQLDLEALKTGIYYLKVENNSGELLKKFFLKQ